MNNRLPQLVFAAALSSGLFLSACSDGGGGAGQDGLSAAVGVTPVFNRLDVVAAPDAAVQMAIDSLAGKSVSSFLELVLPPNRIQEMRAQWSQAKKEPIPAQEGAQFAAFMSMATADGAEDTLFALLKPNLQEVQQQAEGMAQMLPFMIGGAMQDANVPQEAQALLGDFSQSIVKVDFANEEKAHRAVEIFVAAARSLKVRNLEEMQALSFEQALRRVDLAYAGVTDILGVYGLAPDELIKSIKVNTVSTSGDAAEMEMTFRLFGQDQDPVPFQMERVGGRWFPRAPEESAQAKTGLAR